MRSPLRTFRLRAARAARIAIPLLALAAAAATASTPDLFAPIGRQQSTRAERLRKMNRAVVTPERITLLLEMGRTDEARRLAAGLRGTPRAVARARAALALTVHDYPAAKRAIATLAAQPSPTDAERRLRYAWLFAIDDAAAVDRLTRGSALAKGTAAPIPDLLAAGRLAYDMLNYPRAESCFTRALERAGTTPAAAASRAAASRGLAMVDQKRRAYDSSLVRLTAAMDAEASPEVLLTLTETLIRLGRTDEAITAGEWAIRLDPYQADGHYLLGNGYARRNYTELAKAYRAAFADSAGRAAFARADGLLAAGDRSGARAVIDSVRAAHPSWADAAVRIASIDFEDGRYADARARCFDALRVCPEYGRAHATLAKALEFERFAVDVHRPDYEARFAAAPMPEVPGIERFVLNWSSLSPRHQKRVALSIAPWQQFIPVLVEGGSSYYIKPLHQLLSETPGLETLRDTRIEYDSRLWDDVRGAGGFHTVTGIEDVERTIFDRYNTVFHELTHQVHGVLTSDQAREIQEHYRRAKERDDATKNGFLSRYAGGSVWEFYAEGANALYSPKRDAFDPREVVRERLDAIDPELRGLVERRMADTDVSASYPVAYVNAGNDRVERGQVREALAFYDKALARNPNEETALQSLARARALANDRAGAVAAAERALAAHPTSGSVASTAADALWHGGRGIDAALERLERGRERIRSEDRYLVDLALGRLQWIRGDAARAGAAFDSVLGYQSDQPEALWGKGAALALAQRWDEAFGFYDRAVRIRTGRADLRCDYTRDLLRAGRLEAAATQLTETALLDAESPTAEALRGWLALESGHADSARAHARQALAWGEGSDLARIVLGAAESAAGDRAAADRAFAEVRSRIARKEPPAYVYRPKLAIWEAVHELPAVERELLERWSHEATRRP